MGVCLRPWIVTLHHHKKSAPDHVNNTATCCCLLSPIWDPSVLRRHFDRPYFVTADRPVSELKVSMLLPRETRRRYHLCEGRPAAVSTREYRQICGMSSLVTITSRCLTSNYCPNVGIRETNIFMFAIHVHLVALAKIVIGQEVGFC